MIIIILFLVLGAANADINIDIAIESTTNEVTVKHSGFESFIISDHDLKLFTIDELKLKSALKAFYGQKPSNIYLKDPTPWNNLFKTYHWEPVKKILKISSVKLKSVDKKHMIVLSHDYENLSNKTIKVNTGISQTVENTITTTWSKNHEIELSQDIQYGISVLLAKGTGTTGITYRNNWGESEEKSESVTIGTTSSVETELKPGQGATAVLSANRGFLEVEITYTMYLRGNIAVNFQKAFKGHHFWAPSIGDVLSYVGISNDVNALEIVKLGYYSDATLKVFDKDTGLPL